MHRRIAACEQNSTPLWKLSEIKLVAHLRKHLGHPKFAALGERLERIKERHELGQMRDTRVFSRIWKLVRPSDSFNRTMLVFIQRVDRHARSEARWKKPFRPPLCIGSA